MIVVKISQGSLKGGKSETDSGLEYYEFLGVPYAKPPVAELRFKSPQLPEAWDGERDATKCSINSTACQLDFKDGKIVGSEDCLYLNVYTPRLPGPESQLLMPVIVYIHEGGFTTGNGTIKSEHDPDILLEHGTVVVTINYRLRVFGFLSLGIPEAAGNMGLKDQVKALEWVQKNISQFGGDSNNVTISGVSAGSASVEYLIMSPLGKGLFHKAILRSGSVLNHWAINFKPLDLVRSLVNLLDFKGSTEDVKALHDFLISIPMPRLIEAASQAVDNTKTTSLFCGFVPTIEKDFGNGEAFLTTSPLKLLIEGNFNKVPVMKGFCNKEGSLTYLFLPDCVKKLIEVKNLANCWAYIDSNAVDDYNKKLTNAYLQIKDDINEALYDFFGDLDFVSGIWISGKIMARKGVPVYMYQFAYDGRINFFKKAFSVEKEGALHCDDQTYFLKHRNFQHDADEYDILVQKRTAELCTNFAKTGEPITATNDLIPVSWPDFTEDSPVYLRIDKQLTLEYDYEPKKIAIFEKYYEPK